MKTTAVVIEHFAVAREKIQGTVTGQNPIGHLDPAVIQALEVTTLAQGLSPARDREMPGGGHLPVNAVTKANSEIPCSTAFPAVATLEIHQVKNH